MKHLHQNFRKSFSSLSNRPFFLERRFLYDVEGGSCYPEAVDSLNERQEVQNRCHERLTALRHKVERGDTLGKIAKDYKTSVPELKKLNNISNENLIIVGQQLTISPKVSGSLYSVQSGETSNDNISIVDLFQNPDSTKRGLINLPNDKPALRDFIDPNTFQKLSFTLQNARGEEIQVAFKKGDWRIVQNGMVSDKRALIWKGKNTISNVQEERFAQTREGAISQKVEVLAEDLIRVRCTSAEAIECERQQKVFDELGRRIIYYITDTQKFSMNTAKASYREDGTPYKKQFLAFHGTGFDERQFGRASDFLVTKSAINTGVRSADFAFLVGKSGAIYQFFDENIGYGALGGMHLQRNGLGKYMNRETIAIELALRGDPGKYEYGVEQPEENSSQLRAGKALRDFLIARYNISDDYVITSKDPVRGVSGAHSDDFDEIRRVALGIQTSEDAQILVAQIQDQQQKITLASRKTEKKTREV